MGVENFGDILHIIILTLILVWLFYNHRRISLLEDQMRRIADSHPGSQKTADKQNNRQDRDFQLKR